MWAFLEKGREITGNFQAFMKFRARGTLSEFRRKWRSEHERGAEEVIRGVAAREDAPESRASRNELRGALAECCSRLGGRLAAVLRMKYGEKLAPKDIAERLSIAPNTVHVHMFRAVRQVRECLGRKGFKEWHPS